MSDRTIDQFIDRTDPAWPLVMEWLTAGRNFYEVLPADRHRSEAILLTLQVTTRSPLGAVALETGGILLDHGWLRFLGSGSDRIYANLLTFSETGNEGADPLNGGLVVAVDAVGGFYALNGGAFPGKHGDVYYLAPDTLRWEPIGMPYSGLLHWASHGNLEEFYTSMRWPDWERELSGLTGDQVISFYPPLWADGEPLSERSRRSISLVDSWNLARSTAKQIRDLPDGTAVRLVTDSERSV